MSCDPRFLAGSGREVFTGNELLVKGALETEGGVHLLTGYPGSPVAGFFDVLGDLKDLLKSKGVRAYQANNEALGVAAVNGSQMAPLKAICAFKSVGTHVASAVTVAPADGRANAQSKPNQFPTLTTNRKVPLDTSSLELERTVLLPPRTWKRELELADRYRITMDKARELGINKIHPR